MTVCAFITKIECHMIGCGGCHVVGHVAIHTFNTQGFEPEVGSRLVTAATFGCQMGPQERKPSLPVDVCNIVDDPGVWGVAPSAIISQGLFMHVGMTLVAFCLRLGKYQGGMALSAIYLCMLSQKGHFGCIVVKGIDFHIQFPTFGTVALAAGNLEIVPVGGIGLPCRLNKNEQHGGQYQ